MRRVPKTVSAATLGVTLGLVPTTVLGSSPAAAAGVTVTAVNGSQSGKSLRVCTEAGNSSCSGNHDSSVGPNGAKSGVEAVWTPAGTRSYFRDGDRWRLWLDARQSPRFGAWRNVHDLPDRLAGERVAFKWID